MHVVVDCRCGQKYAAKYNLIGQEVSCPECGSPLAIAANRREQPQGIYMTCPCGRAFIAPQATRGQPVKCKACDRYLKVPLESAYPDPLGLVAPGPATEVMVRPKTVTLKSLSPAVADSDDDSQIPWPLLKRMGMIGTAVLVLVVIATTLVDLWTHSPPLPKTDHIVQFVKDRAPNLVPSRLPPVASAEPDAAAGESDDVALPPSPEQTIPLALPPAEPPQ